MAILALGCIAPIVTALDRVGDAGPLQYRIFPRLFLFDDRVNAIAMEAAFLVALAWPGVREAVGRLATAVSERPVHACVLAFVSLAAASRLVYIGHPLSMDEYAPLLQASAFAHGDVAVHYPPNLVDAIVKPGFQGYFLFVNRSTGQVMSTYWPGLALLLTPFEFVQAPWLLNPLLSAAALWLIGDFAGRAAGTPARGWAMLAALASPQFTANAISFYAMPGLLALNLLFVWLLVRSGWRSAIAAGVVGSVALVLHNPVPHFLVAAPCLIWMALRPSRWPRLAVVVAGYLPLAALLGVGWPLLTASMGMQRTGVPLPPEVRGHFIAEWVVRLHRLFAWPSDDVLLARWYGSLKMWVWACPGALLLTFAWRRRDRAEQLLLATFVLTYAFYFLVLFDQGHGWGYRYIHSAWGVVPVAAGIWFARDTAQSRWLAGAAVAAGLAATPVFLWQIHGHVAESLAQRIAPPEDGRWVVFVNDQPGRYTGDVVQNYADDDRVVYLNGLGRQKDRVFMAANFPGAELVLADSRGSAWRLPAPAR